MTAGVPVALVGAAVTHCVVLASMIVQVVVDNSVIKSNPSQGEEFLRFGEATEANRFPPRWDRRERPLQRIVAEKFVNRGK